MPQIDRHRERIVPIEFESFENFKSLPYAERMTLILVTNGLVKLNFNGTECVANSPCVFLLSPDDNIKVIEQERLSAKSFAFNPIFLNSKLTFEALEENAFTDIENEHDRNMLNMFRLRNENYNGYLSVPANTYLRISEWMGIMGTETFAQSDGYWTCRIRRYLLQTLYLIDDIYSQIYYTAPKKSPVDIALEYIHTSYQNDISLDELCKIAKTNRTTLNKQFKEKHSVTAIAYLLNYRIKIACEALRHTNLSLAEIAEATGFKYDTYFIKQFTAKMKKSPTDYRWRK